MMVKLPINLKKQNKQNAISKREDSIIIISEQ